MRKFFFEKKPDVNQDQEASYFVIRHGGAFPPGSVELLKTSADLPERSTLSAQM